MDFPSPKILKIATPEYKKVIVEASDGMRYYADLTPFAQVHCFPGTKEEWEKVVADRGINALVWASGFDLHIHQVIDHAFKKEKITRPAA